MLKELVIRRTPFYRTSNEVEHYFSNIEQTWTNSSTGDRTLIAYFWLRTIEQWTSNLIGLSLDLLINYSLNFLEHHFSNIEWTRTYLSIANPTWITYFWLRTMEHRTLNIVWPITTKNMWDFVSDKTGPKRWKVQRKIGTFYNHPFFCKSKYYKNNFCTNDQRCAKDLLILGYH